MRRTTALTGSGNRSGASPTMDGTPSARIDLALSTACAWVLRGFPVTSRYMHKPIDWFSISAPLIPLLPFLIASLCVEVPGTVAYIHLACLGRTSVPPDDFGHLLVAQVVTAFWYVVIVNVVLALWLALLVSRSRSGPAPLSSLIRGIRRILYFAAIPYPFLALGTGYWSTIEVHMSEFYTPFWLDACATAALLMGAIARILIVGFAFSRETKASSSTAGIATLGALDAWLMLAFLCQVVAAASTEWLWR